MAPASGSRDIFRQTSQQLACGAVTAVLLAIAQASAGAAQSQDVPDTSMRLFRLYATESHLGRTGKLDTTWRYYSEQGALAYRRQDYPAAERCYESALADAEKQQIDDGNLILIITNLAAAAREEGRFDRSEKLIGRALDLCSRSGGRQPSVYAYLLRQYADLLKKTGREAEAQFARDAAGSGARLVRATDRWGGSGVPRWPLAARVTDGYRPGWLSGGVMDNRTPVALRVDGGPHPGVLTGGVIDNTWPVVPEAPRDQAPLALTPEDLPGPGVYPGVVPDDCVPEPNILNVRVIGIGFFPGMPGPDVRFLGGATWNLPGPCVPCARGRFGPRW